MARPSATLASTEVLPTKIARKRPYGMVIGGTVVIAALTWIVWTFVTNKHIKVEVIQQNLFNENILRGLRTTILLAVWGEVIALILGVVIGFGRLSRNPVVGMVAWLYVWLFRSAPLVVQVLLWGNLALFLPTIGIGNWSTSTNNLLTPFVAGVIALGLHDAAYVAEIVRSGIMSVSEGQREASSALGLSWWQTQRTVVLPQALRIMIPPLGSAFVLLLKSTSLVVVIAGGDLLTEAENISAVNLRTIELLVVAMIWFLAVTSVANVGQWMLERRFNRQNRTRREGSWTPEPVRIQP